MRKKMKKTEEEALSNKRRIRGVSIGKGREGKRKSKRKRKRRRKRRRRRRKICCLTHKSNIH